MNESDPLLISVPFLVNFMGFVTLEVCTGAKPALVQLSDSRLTVKRLLAVIFIALRRTDAVDGYKAEYLDDEGDWVSVVSDGEVAELFRLARSMEPRRLQVICLVHTVYFQYCRPQNG
jgi:hypothetical protein